MDGIFISYRRDDSAGFTGRLYDRLVAHFGAARVFMDVEGIEPGADFVSAIEDAVGSCRVLILIIGDEWTTVTDSVGRRRLDDPNDFIRLETGAALKRGIRVVPVLVGGAVMPRVDELPEELHPLARRQAIEISHKQWDASTGELIRTLERILDANNGGVPASSKQTNEPNSAPLSAAETRPAWALPMASGVAVLALIGGLIWYNNGKRDETFAPSVKVPETAIARPPAEVKEAVAASQAPAPVSRPAANAKPAVDSVVAAGPPAAPLVPPASVAVPAPAPPRAVVMKPLPKPVEPKVEADTPISPGPAESPGATPAVTPAPAAQLSVTPPPVSVPTAAQPGAATAGLPRRGDSWTYRSFGKWPTSPKRSFQITVQSVGEGVVIDALSMINPAGAAGDVKRSRSGKPDFVAWPELGIEFSPYLGGYGDLSRLEAQSGFPTPDLDSQWSQWYSKLKWLGQESVSVPAGTFNSHKVEVWSNRHATGTQVMRASEPVGVHYYVWYAPDVKRYVKMQRRIVAASGIELEKDVFEMVARAR